MHIHAHFNCHVRHATPSPRDGHDRRDIFIFFLNIFLVYYKIFCIFVVKHNPPVAF